METNWSAEENGQRHSGREARKRQRHQESLLLLMAYQKKTVINAKAKNILEVHLILGFWFITNMIELTTVFTQNESES